MTRLMDPNLGELSASMSEMGDLAIQCIELAVSSYIKGTNTINQVRDLSACITKKYHEVGDLIFNTILKIPAGGIRFPVHPFCHRDLIHPPPVWPIRV